MDYSYGLVPVRLDRAHIFIERFRRHPPDWDWCRRIVPSVVPVASIIATRTSAQIHGRLPS